MPLNCGKAHIQCCIVQAEARQWILHAIMITMKAFKTDHLSIIFLRPKYTWDLNSWLVQWYSDHEHVSNRGMVHIWMANHSNCRQMCQVFEFCSHSDKGQSNTRLGLPEFVCPVFWSRCTSYFNLETYADYTLNWKRWGFKYWNSPVYKVDTKRTRSYFIGPSSISLP